MTSIFENLTKVPSQVLVNSASTFGEKAAQIISAHAESAIKSSSDHLVREVKESSEKITGAVTNGLSSFGDIFHRTGVEAFTEWGIGIERAFLHLGHKLEMGLSNGSQKLSVGMSQSLEENTKQINETIASSTDVLAESITEFGIIQAKEIHHEFRWEIIVLTWCFVTIAFSTVIFAITLFSRSELLGMVIKVCSDNLAAVSFVMLSLLIGYLAHASQQPSNPALSYPPQQENTRQQKPVHHPGALVLVIGAVGFALGQTSHTVFSSSSFSSIFALLVLILSAFISYYTFSYAILSKCYAVYRTILDFKAFYEAQQLQQRIHNASMNDSTSATTTGETTTSQTEKEAAATSPPTSSHPTTATTTTKRPSATLLNANMKPQTSSSQHNLRAAKKVKNHTFASIMEDSDSSSTSSDS